MRIASWIHIDEMRTLLEMHYDTVHFEKWKRKDGKAPLRKGEHIVLNKVVQAYRSNLCQRLVLPKAVKDILRKPSDENSWLKLEELRKAIALEVEGEEFVFLATQEEADALASAIETSAGLVDEVGLGSKIPAGARVLVDGAEADVGEAVRGMADDYVRTLMRPFGTQRAPLVDGFCKQLVGDRTAEELARDMGLTAEKILDNMLLCLFDALFLKQSEEWSKRRVANVPADETPELARWFMKGQAVGAKAICNGICAQCGCLLAGTAGHHSALSNKMTGQPIDRDGNPLLKDDGSPNEGAPPPFLLRFSPALFAKEASISVIHIACNKHIVKTQAPAMFQHDPDTNRLSLKEGMREPWRRIEHWNQRSTTST